VVEIIRWRLSHCGDFQLHIESIAKLYYRSPTSRSCANYYLGTIAFSFNNREGKKQNYSSLFYYLGKTNKCNSKC
jgi:hypothetical protein